VPKFELYKHNDELLNIYYRIVYELWTFTDFDRLCKLKKRGDGGHLGYRMALTDTILKGDHLRIILAKFGWDWLNSVRGEDFFLISSPLFSNLHKCGKLKLQTCSACEDLPTLQFLSKSHYRFWSYCPVFIKRHHQTQFWN
jgi:hypothetical protein